MPHRRPDGAPYDWWRDSNVRYLGYANEFGEAFRPLIPKQAVWASYAVAIGYAAGDAVDKTQLEMAKSGDTKRSLVIGGCAAVWQFLASVTLPAFAVHKQVDLTTQVLSTRAPPAVARFGPTFSGLAVIPFLPYILDPPITMAVDSLERALLA
eukprot:TRINITY_DN23223_c0_g1_i1.p3 TRINITY_DN23223_c0_g1~~TRINITY_DN23223_c0_g1_i1.p3  ORF type:complete len:164 (+),score=54.97 TRINITY_DN23223_c0_g1_i1:36-494(+)